MILLPQTEHAPFDLVIYKDGSFKRVQVKYRELNSKGIIEIRFRSSYCNSNGTVNTPINKEEVDLYCVYCPQTDECYCFDPKMFEKSISLRVETPKNNQTANIKLAKDYREVP
ncbi:group I intron-associated PD-(D/E)XK endonuclease [Bacillus sp. FJAT-52991]|uniref:Group I intron-associated PD-(D/E)XK endonuclease n=1 Tax=Bacillus kandeliae TaxID=3129297 RepID=A0ABZ2N3M0_9BACI